MQLKIAGDTSAPLRLRDISRLVNTFYEKYTDGEGKLQISVCFQGRRLLYNLRLRRPRRGGSPAKAVSVLITFAGSTDLAEATIDLPEGS